MAELPWKINDLLSLNSDNSQQEVFYVLNNDDDDLYFLHSKALLYFSINFHGKYFKFWLIRINLFQRFIMFKIFLGRQYMLIFHISIPHNCHGRHGRCPCKFFLPGVIFSRLNAKNLPFYSII